jgi:hypothetical protein
LISTPLDCAQETNSVWFSPGSKAVVMAAADGCESKILETSQRVGLQSIYGQ